MWSSDDGRCGDWGLYVNDGIWMWTWRGFEIEIDIDIWLRSKILFGF